MATIKDVAKLAGVSAGTVSKALNDYKNISEDTKVKVRQAADDLNYQPNIVAASLASKNRHRIALVISVNNQKQAIDEINMQYILGATNKCIELGYDTSVVFTPTIADLNETDLINHFRARAISGIIMFSISKEHYVLHNLIKKQVFSTVVVDGDFVNEKTSCVTVDHYKGQQEVVDRLVSENPLDYKPTILYIAGGVEGYVTEVRTKAVVDYCNVHDINLVVKHGDFSEKNAGLITKDYYEGVDYIVCASDLMAIGAMHALQDLDVFKPICGYDGISLMGYAAQDMLTCVQNFNDVAQTSVLALRDLLDGKPSSIHMLSYEIREFNYTDVIF